MSKKKIVTFFFSLETGHDSVLELQKKMTNIVY
jgi:hypothetical protein